MNQDFSIMHNSKVAEEVSLIDVPIKDGSERSQPTSAPNGIPDVVMFKSSVGSVVSPRGIPTASTFACQTLLSSDVGMLDMTIDEEVEQNLEKKVRLMRFSTTASNVEASFDSRVGLPISGTTSTPDSPAPHADSQDISSEEENEMYIISITQDDDVEDFSATQIEPEEDNMRNDESPDLIDENYQFCKGTEEVSTSCQVSSVDATVYDGINPEFHSEAEEENVGTGVDLNEIVQQLNSMESEIITPWSRDGQQYVPPSPSTKFAPSIQQGKPITFPTHWREIKAQALSSTKSDRLESIETEDRDRPRNRLLKAICIERMRSSRRRAANNEERESLGSGRRWWSGLRKSTRTEEHSVRRSHNLIQKVCSVFRTCF